MHPPRRAPQQWTQNVAAPLGCWTHRPNSLRRSLTILKQILHLRGANLLNNPSTVHRWTPKSLHLRRDPSSGLGLLPQAFCSTPNKRGVKHTPRTAPQQWTRTVAALPRFWTHRQNRLCRRPTILSFPSLRSLEMRYWPLRTARLDGNTVPQDCSSCGVAIDGLR